MSDNLEKPVAVATLTESKPWYTSKTMVASIVGFLVTALGFLGVQIDPELQGTIVEVLSQVGALVAFVVAAWGRWTAKTTLS
jgi:hypothetical protein